MPSPTLAETIQELYSIVGRLEHDYEKHKRHFTLDGHLVGSIGEVYAAERYGLELYKASHPLYDAWVKADPEPQRQVQVKATQRERVALSGRPDYLIVLHISREGEFEEVYNGPGAPTWKRGEDDGRQYQVSLSRLRKLNAQVADANRIPVVK